MANELTEHQQNLVSLVQGHELGDILKPLIKEIHLFDSYIAGTTHLDDKSVLEKIAVGDMLSLQREDFIDSVADDSFGCMRGNDFWEEMLKKGVDSPLRAEDTLSSDPDQNT